MTGSAAPTERLYYTDAYRAEFSARVIDRADDGRRVYLDSTAFYPTSGGQLHDLGILGGVHVVDVIDEGPRIAHVLAQPMATDAVSGSIDWARRFDHMQQHTGQHLLSAVFDDLFGMRTVSVHFGADSSTLDLEADALSSANLERAERRANEVIAENRTITVMFEEATAATGLRKAIDREGSLRIVSIDGLDRSACGGTHVRTTGEIGCVMLRGTERIRKTMRVQFLCGLRAVRRSRADYSALSAIAAGLSSSIDDLPALVASQSAQLKRADTAVRDLDRELAVFRVDALLAAARPDGASDAVHRLKWKGSVDTTRTMAQESLNRHRVVFVGETDTGIIVAATEDSGVDAARVLREALAVVGGKGGGSPRLAQGSVPTADGMQTLTALIDAALAPGR